VRVVRLRSREGRRLRGGRLPGGRASALEGPVVVATSDRDAFQLASDRVTILQPVKGVSELARVGPAEVRERYGVEPEQVPDFIALARGLVRPDPGRARVGPKTAATSCAVRRPRRGAEGGRFAAEATSSASTADRADGREAPLPRLAAQTPDWARAAPRHELGLGGLAGRLELRAAQGGAR
jgi:DNA polymerase-1